MGSSDYRPAYATVTPLFPRLRFSWEVGDADKSGRVTVTVTVHNIGNHRGALALGIPDLSGAENVDSVVYRGGDMRECNSESDFFNDLSEATHVPAASKRGNRVNNQSDAPEPRYWRTLEPQTSTELEFNIRITPGISADTIVASSMPTLDEGDEEGGSSIIASTAAASLNVANSTTDDAIVQCPLLFFTDEPTLLSVTGRRQFSVPIARASTDPAQIDKYKRDAILEDVLHVPTPHGVRVGAQCATRSTHVTQDFPLPRDAAELFTTTMRLFSDAAVTELVNFSTESVLAGAYSGSGYVDGVSLMERLTRDALAEVTKSSSLTYNTTATDDAVAAAMHNLRENDSTAQASKELEWKMPMVVEAPSVGDVECVICGESSVDGAGWLMCNAQSCDGKHVLCSDCACGYVETSVFAELMAKNVTSVSNADVFADTEGIVFCMATTRHPVRLALLTAQVAGTRAADVAGQCMAPPFTDEQLRRVPNVWQRVVAARQHLAALKRQRDECVRAEEERVRLLDEEEQRKARKRSQAEADIRQQFAGMSNLLQCPRCGHGPVEALNCSNLQTHNGQASGRGVINNSCGACSFFSADRNAWHAFNGDFSRLLNDVAVSKNLTVRQQSPAELTQQAAEREIRSKDFILGAEICQRSLKRAHVALKSSSAMLGAALSGLANNALWLPSFRTAARITGELARAWQHLHEAFRTAIDRAKPQFLLSVIDWTAAIGLFKHLLRSVKLASALFAPIAPRPVATSVILSGTAATNNELVWRRAPAVGLANLRRQVLAFARTVSREDRARDVADSLREADPDVGVVRFADDTAAAAAERDRAHAEQENSTEDDTAARKRAAEQREREDEDERDRARDRRRKREHQEQAEREAAEEAARAAAEAERRLQEEEAQDAEDEANDVGNADERRERAAEREQARAAAQQAADLAAVDGAPGAAAPDAGTGGGTAGAADAAAAAVAAAAATDPAYRALRQDDINNAFDAARQAYANQRLGRGAEGLRGAAAAQAAADALEGRGHPTWAATVAATVAAAAVAATNGTTAAAANAAAVEAANVMAQRHHGLQLREDDIAAAAERAFGGVRDGRAQGRDVDAAARDAIREGLVGVGFQFNTENQVRNERVQADAAAAAADAATTAARAANRGAAAAAVAAATAAAFANEAGRGAAAAAAAAAAAGAAIDGGANAEAAVAAAVAAAAAIDAGANSGAAADAGRRAAAAVTSYGPGHGHGTGNGTRNGRPAHGLGRGDESGHGPNNGDGAEEEEEEAVEDAMLTQQRLRDKARHQQTRDGTRHNNAAAAGNSSGGGSGLSAAQRAMRNAGVGDDAASGNGACGSSNLGRSSVAGDPGNGSSDGATSGNHLPRGFGPSAARGSRDRASAGVGHNTDRIKFTDSFAAESLRSSRVANALTRGTLHIVADNAHRNNDDDDEDDDDSSGTKKKKAVDPNDMVEVKLTGEELAAMQHQMQQQRGGGARSYVRMDAITDEATAFAENDIQRVDHSTYELLANLPSMRTFVRALVQRARSAIMELSRHLSAAPEGTMPVAFCIVIDCSESMSGRRGEFARTALVLLLETFRRLECPVSVVKFSGSRQQNVLLAMGARDPFDYVRGERIMTELAQAGRGTRYAEALQFTATSGFTLANAEDGAGDGAFRTRQVKALMHSVLVISDGEIESVRDEDIARNLYPFYSAQNMHLAFVQIHCDSVKGDSAADDFSQNTFNALREFYSKCTGVQASARQWYHVFRMLDSKMNELPRTLGRIVESQLREHIKRLESSSAANAPVARNVAHTAPAPQASSSVTAGVGSVMATVRRLTRVDNRTALDARNLVEDVMFVGPTDGGAASAASGGTRGGRKAKDDGFHASALDARPHKPDKSGTTVNNIAAGNSAAQRTVSQRAQSGPDPRWAATRVVTGALTPAHAQVVENAWREVLARLAQAQRGLVHSFSEGCLPVNRFSIGAPAAKGSKLSMAGVMRFLLTNGMNRNIFEAQAEGGSRKYSLGILLDRSSSLSGPAGAEAQRAAVLLAATFVSLELPQFAVMAFGDVIEVLKRRDEPFTALHKLRLLAATECVAARTNDAEAVASIAQHLAQGAGDDTPALLFVFTDGYSSDPVGLRQTLQTAEAQGVTVVAVSVGNPDADVAAAYHHYVMARDLAALPDALLRWAGGEGAHLPPLPPIEDVLDDLDESAAQLGDRGRGDAHGVWDERKALMRTRGQNLENEIVLRVNRTALRNVGGGNMDGGDRDMSFDIVIAIDTTGSMSSYIDGLRRHVTTVVNNLAQEIKQRIGRNAVIRLGIAPYNDHKPGCTRTTCDTGRYGTCHADYYQPYDFVEDMNNASTFMHSLNVVNGDDCEDVLGGLWKATNLTWRANKGRFVLLIGDMPCHGVQYNQRQGYPSTHDSIPGGDPKGITPEMIVNKLDDDARAAGAELHMIAVDPHSTGNGERTFMEPMLMYFSDLLEAKGRKPVKRVPQGHGVDVAEFMRNALHSILSLVTEDVL